MLRIQQIRGTECDVEGCTKPAEFYAYTVIELQRDFSVEVRLRLCANHVATLRAWDNGEEPVAQAPA